MRTIMWIVVALLLTLHQDFWFWNDGRLVFGFLPVGLFYHMCLSLAAGLTWFLMVTYAWPRELDTLDSGGASSDDPSQRGNE